MAIITKRYTVPVKGEMDNWETCSGKNSNPIRPTGVLEFLKRGKYKAKIILVCLEESEDGLVSKVDIEAEESVINAIDSWMTGKTMSDMVADADSTRLELPKGVRFKQRLFNQHA